MRLEIWFDGSCQPFNPGGRGGFGWIAYEDQRPVAQNHGFIGEGPAISNNVAEYAAVLDAMTWVELNRPAATVTFYGDSALVIHQLSGHWKIRGGLYTSMARQAKAKVQRHWSFKWIPRERNEEADALSEIADRHYNRQKPGTPQFVPPGRCMVLLSLCERALWVTSWPFAEYVRHAWPGAWVNSCFRNEGAGLSSELIGEAVSATRAFYGTPPSLGIVSFVDASKIKHKRDPGRCYRKAGWTHIGFTKGGLWVYQQKAEDMPPPEMPIRAQPSLSFGASTPGISPRKPQSGPIVPP